MTYSDPVSRRGRPGEPRGEVRGPRSRWLDPVSYARSVSPLSYVGADPINFTDPSGLGPSAAKDDDDDHLRDHDITVTGRLIRSALNLGPSTPLRTRSSVRYPENPNADTPLERVQDDVEIVVTATADALKEARRSARFGLRAIDWVFDLARSLALPMLFAPSDFPDPCGCFAGGTLVDNPGRREAHRCAADPARAVECPPRRFRCLRCHRAEL